MWSNFIQYYKDPHLVRRAQEYFGIEIHYDDQQKKEAKTNGLSDSISHVNGYSIQENDNTTKKSKSHSENSELYTINNYLWYYLFRFGTELGDEIFYLMFIPFWFWNIDVTAGRRIIFVWAIIMTTGQTLKDIIRWPRPPCPPVVRLQNKWTQEYGMPSTHAMIGITMPSSVILFTMDKFIYSLPAAWIAVILWCSLICVSRIYLGMHTVLDIIAGLVLAILMMIPVVPLADAVDYYMFTNSWALLVLVTISIAIIIYYPCSDKWTPTRGDTTLVVSVIAGIYVGAWLNYKTGALSMPQIPPPYEILWPSFLTFGKLVLRHILGFIFILCTKTICKNLSYTIICAILQVNSKELMKSKDSLENKNKILVDLVYKYITCFMIGFNTVYLLPYVFTMIGLKCPTFLTGL